MAYAQSAPGVVKSKKIHGHERGEGPVIHAMARQLPSCTRFFAISYLSGVLRGYNAGVDPTKIGLGFAAM